MKQTGILKILIPVNKILIKELINYGINAIFIFYKFKIIGVSFD